MPGSTDAGHYFQTEASLVDSSRKATKARNEHGDPIRLPSKLLDVAADPDDDGYVYVAESAGTAKRVKLDNGDTALVYRGAVAPLTSVWSIGERLVAGCWDKRIWSWNRHTAHREETYIGHADFIKAVCCFRLRATNILLSGAADAAIIMWNCDTGQKLHTLKGSSRGVLGFSVDPLDSTPDAAVVFSAGSIGEIRRWTIGLDAAGEAQDAPSIREHETSVYKIRFDADGDLWTASADKTAKCLARDQGWKPDTVLPHPDFVKDVVVDEAGGKVITACRDEEIRVWDRATGDLYHTFSGHYEEVTGLAIQARLLISVSIDCTIRKWSLKPDDLMVAIAAEKDKEKREEKEKEKEKEKGKEKESLLTQDEEDELAELMDDS
ncbi:MAG: hypothetical protein M1837_004310 [Sclerophora amabilis]|nr:MAG: hypothetical protein M1837_004310 [Sclerophora amabilis]